VVEVEEDEVEEEEVVEEAEAVDSEANWLAGEEDSVASLGVSVDCCWSGGEEKVSISLMISGAVMVMGCFFSNSRETMFWKDRRTCSIKGSVTVPISRRPSENFLEASCAVEDFFKIFFKKN